MKYYRKTFANINLRNLSHNFGEIKKAIGEKSFICPMVKANAYGHGAVEITNRLINDGAKQVGVCLIEEALELRQAGIKIPILTFDIFDRDAAEAILEHELTPVISCWQQLEVLKEFCKKKRKHCRIHLKFNTGMSRLGFGLAEAEKLAATFSADQPRPRRLCCDCMAGHPGLLPLGGRRSVSGRRRLAVAPVRGRLLHGVQSRGRRSGAGRPRGLPAGYRAVAMAVRRPAGGPSAP